MLPAIFSLLQSSTCQQTRHKLAKRDARRRRTCKDRLVRLLIGRHDGSRRDGQDELNKIKAKGDRHMEGPQKGNNGQQKGGKVHPRRERRGDCEMKSTSIHKDDRRPG